MNTETTQTIAEPTINLKKLTPYLVALGLAVLAQLIQYNSLNFSFPVGPIDATISPNEIFLVIGAALTGPLAGLLIAIGATTLFPATTIALGLPVHIAGALLMSFGYRFVYSRLEGWKRILGWVGLISIYYVIVAPLLPTIVTAINPQLRLDFFGEISSFELLKLLLKVFVPEYIMTLLISTTIMFLLPRKYQKPMWYEN